MVNAIAIDLGTHTTVVAVANKGVVLREPTLVALNQRTNKVVAFGNHAIDVVHKHPTELVLQRPLNGGTVTDYRLTREMMFTLYKRLNIGRLSRENILISIPCQATEVERDALRDAATPFRLLKVAFIEEPLAAAIGAELPIQDPVGSMIVDLGGGNTEASIISMGGIVLYNSTKIGGLDLDDAIQEFLRDRFGVGIGDKTAQEVKHTLGCAWPTNELVRAKVLGRSFDTGVQTEVEITSEDVRLAIDHHVTKIVETIINALSESPPELSQDTMVHGITLAGGGAKLFGLDERITAETQVKVHVADYPDDCVIHGMGAVLRSDWDVGV